MGKLRAQNLFALFMSVMFLMSGLISLSHMCLDQKQSVSLNQQTSQDVDLQTELNLAHVETEHHDESSHDNDGCGCPLHKVCCSVLTLNVPTSHVFYRSQSLNNIQSKFISSLNPEPLLDGPFQPPRV